MSVDKMVCVHVCMYMKSNKQKTFMKHYQIYCEMYFGIFIKKKKKTHRASVSIEDTRTLRMLFIPFSACLLPETGNTKIRVLSVQTITSQSICILKARAFPNNHYIVLSAIIHCNTFQLFPHSQRDSSSGNSHRQNRHQYKHILYSFSWGNAKIDNISTSWQNITGYFNHARVVGGTF